jgi:DNA-3-methyladenine glycosylase
VARLPRWFFDRPCLEVAPALLGRHLVRALPDGERLRGRIVEVEAYTEDDPASHSFRGPTGRNAVMFGPPGRLYVYFTYGMHWCMNVVTGPRGEGSAVLLRAAEPLDGLAVMQRNRGERPARELLAGPARWTQAFAVDDALDGADLVRGHDVWIESGREIAPTSIRRTPRIGVRVGTTARWRFVDAGSIRWLSRPLGGRASGALVTRRPRSAAQP